MLQTRDYISFLVGAVLAVLGILPLLSLLKLGPGWFALTFIPVEIFAFILAIAGGYLLMDSVIEITNSNPIGKTSFIIAIVVFALGILQVFNRVHVGPDWFALAFIKPWMYHILFVIEGIFLMLAMFAMEL